MDFKNNIDKIEKTIGYTFKDKTLLEQAFTRTSFSNENKVRGKKVYQSNEVLEFFGDGILSAAIITLFIKEFADRYEHGIKTKFKEGDFTVIRSKLSDKKNLSARISALGLGKYLKMGEGDAKLGIEEEASVLEDLFESIIGAIYIDCGMELGCVVDVVAGMLDINEVLSSTGDVRVTAQSYKNQLQEYCADKKHRLPPPVYKTVSESGPDHKKVYERACYVADRLYAVGKGKNQKSADSDAAQKTLALLVEESERAADREIAARKEQDAQALVRLREYSKAQKKPSPVFRDLGESENSTAKRREYCVVCSFMGYEECGLGLDKTAARCASAKKVLDDIERENKKCKKIPKTEKIKPRVTKIKKINKTINKKVRKD